MLTRVLETVLGNIFMKVWIYTWLGLRNAKLVSFPPGYSVFNCLGWPGLRNAKLVGNPPGCSFFDRLSWPGLWNAKLVGFPPGCSFFDRLAWQGLRNAMLVCSLLAAARTSVSWQRNWPTAWQRSARLASASSYVRRTFMDVYVAQYWCFWRAANSSRVYREEWLCFGGGPAGGRHSSAIIQRKNSWSETATCLTGRMFCRWDGA